MVPPYNVSRYVEPFVPVCSDSEDGASRSGRSHLLLQGQAWNKEPYSASRCSKAPVPTVNLHRGTSKA